MISTDVTRKLLGAWFGRGEMSTLDLITAMYPEDYFYITDFLRQEAIELFDRDHQEKPQWVNQKISEFLQPIDY